MKKLIALFITVLITLSLCIPALAHSGDTDSKGGHYNHNNGVYHYHHGYPEHQHPGGECPYKSDDKDKSAEHSSSNDYDLSDDGGSDFWHILGQIVGTVGIIAWIAFIVHLWRLRS